MTAPVPYWSDDREGERRPLLVDLFCKAGGASMGYHRAGFDVIGVDIEPQPRYPFRFVQADALEFIAAADLATIDAWAASPPCQDHMRGGQHPERGTGWLLAATRTALQATGKPWVIENVPGAPMRADFRICGCQVGLLHLRRERWFETSWHAFAMNPGHDHSQKVISVVGNGTPTAILEKWGRGIGADECREAMGISWMTRQELSRAIPSAYTEIVGRALLAELMEAAA